MLQVKEVEEEVAWCPVPRATFLPFWPVFGGQSVICRVAGEPGVTVPFSLTDEHPSLLPLTNRSG